MANFRPPKQWVLTESETITSYANWHTNILYHLSLCNDFAPYLETEWSKQQVANRGFVDDTEAVQPVEANRKTAVQKKIVLNRILGIVAQFAPPLLRNEVIKCSTSLSWIWARIRRHYNFSQSEVNLLGLSSIQRKEDERYETLYQRIIAHLEDNLLTVASGLLHDGEVIAEDEVMSPTIERLAVLHWLSLIDKRLPTYVARVFAHDLQSKTLKEIQPQLALSMDSLLAEISAQEDIQVHYARSSFSRNRLTKSFQTKTGASRSAPSKSCILCKASGPRYEGHNITTCWFVSKFEKMEMVKALQVCVEDTDESVEVNRTIYQESSPEEAAASPSVVGNATTDSSVKKVACDTSPFFYAFYAHHPCHVVIDSGATSSIVSRAFLQAVGITPKTTLHSARSADKSQLDVRGEVHMTLQLAGINLPVTALVLDKLDCDILAGIPFCKSNDIQIHMKSESISISDIKIPYGARDIVKPFIINRAESVIVRNDSAKVIMPGEYIEIYADELKSFDGEVAIEPHTESPLSGQWPIPSITRVIQGSVRIPNLTNEPVSITKSQHLAQIRRVVTPSQLRTASTATDYATPVGLHRKPPPISTTPTTYSESVTIDPDGQLTRDQRKDFADINKAFDSRFSTDFGCYNDKYGTI